MATATTKSTSKFTAAQEVIILEAVRANNNVANLTLAETLAARADMACEDGSAREVRSVTAKLSRMKDANGFTYERKAPVTKSGEPVTNKLALVARIATLAGITADMLDGLEKAPKGTLQTIAGFAERLASYEDESETVAA